MSLLRGFCSWIIFVYFFIHIVAYHFDPDNVILYEDEIHGSYFGFSVALWNPSNHRRPPNPTIFIGAPRAYHTTESGSKIDSGNVFECGIKASQSQCKEWKPIERDIVQTGAWLGGSLAVVNSPKLQAVVCAPKWYNKVNETVVMKGMCYRINKKKLHRLQYKLPISLPNEEKPPYGQLAQLGFTIDVIPDGELKYILGCPGIYDWRGTPCFLDEGTGFSIPNVTKTDSMAANSLSGYAVTLGRYFNAKRYYATGAPRAANLCGSVIIFKYTEVKPEPPIDPITNVSGKQIGEYFGSALASCDIDGDGTDELLVGAPHWTEISDEGRIYIFTRRNDGKEKFKDLQHIDGTAIKARFGSAITCLGDIDKDGYGDFAVGAPYDGNGTVYIFHGRKDGLLRPTQIISAPKGTRGFGISISKPIDIDNNGYADIAVGAYLSGHVTLLRSKYVVSTNITLNSSLSENKLSRDTKSFDISVCCSPDMGKNAPPNLNVTRVLKIDDIHQRAYLDVTGEQLVHTFNLTLTVDRSKECQSFRIYLRDNINEFSDPLRVSVSQHLNTHNETGSVLIKGTKRNGTDYFFRVPALMNQSHQEDHLDILFAVECGKGTTCNSILSINVTNWKTISHYVIGSKQYIELNIAVSNTGDPAYSTNAVVCMPSFIQLSGSPSCEKIDNGKTDNQTVVQCFIANRLNENVTKEVTLRLDMSSVPSDTKEIPLKAEAITQSNDSFTENHVIKLQINCVAKADIGIAGETNRDLHSYTLGKQEAQLPNLQFNHTYEIKSYDSTPIVEAVLNVSIPTHWLDGGTKIEFLKLNEIITDLNGNEFSCTDGEENSILSSYDAYEKTEWLIRKENSSKSRVESKFQVIAGKVFSTCANNRTFFINCTDPAYKWKTINCKLRPLNSSQFIAKLVLVFELILSNFTPEMMEDRDMIFFVTNGSTRITKPLGITETINKKPHSILIGTRFIGTPAVHGKPAPVWILPASIGVGLLLLILIIIALVKYGFFKRAEKAKLESLKKEQENMSPRFLLETTSSREALDAI